MRRYNAIIQITPRFNFTWFLAGTFVGSFVTYLSDPERGLYRRSLIKDIGIKYARELQNRLTDFKTIFEKALGKDKVEYLN